MNGFRALQRLSLIKVHTSRTIRAPFSAAMSTTDTPKGDKITNWASGDGHFRRQPSQFRSWISSKPGSEFPPEAGRYHLFVSYACPWAHRTLIVRRLKGLEDLIDYTTVHWHMDDKGWRFVTEDEAKNPQSVGVLPGDESKVRRNPLGHSEFARLRDLYFSVEPGYTGRFTVPTLYDTKTKTIVSNESADIIRMLYHEFDALLPQDKKVVDLLPQSLEKEIDAMNEWVYPNVNNGVYRSGFATSQEAYTQAVTQLFESLDRLEKHLVDKKTPFLFGDKISEADVRLYTTIIRFDPVYAQHFKCNIRDIRSGYPLLHAWLRRLYWDFPAFGETTQFEHIKNHYTRSHPNINPHAITPVGPLPDILPKDQEVNAVKAASKRG